MSTEKPSSILDEKSSLKSSKEKSGKLKWILLAAFGGFVIIGLSISTTMLLMRSKDAQGTKKGQITEKTENFKTDSSPKKYSGTPLFYNIRPVFVVNIPSKSRIRLLQIEVDIMSRNSKTIDSLKAFEPLVKSELVNLFSSKDYEVLITQQGKEELRKEALLKVQSILKDQAGVEGVEQILFTSFVTQ